MPLVDLGLRGRVAIVTGASRGIGRRVAVDLAAEGCDVVLCGRDRDALEAVRHDVEAAGGGAQTIAIDLTTPGAATRVVDEARAFRPRVDILVNNAGGDVPKKLLDLTDADWQRGFDVNFFAAVHLTLGCVPSMRAQGWGRIVNVASTSGRRPDPYFGPYSAAKAALINFSANISRAYAADGVLSNCVIPGITRTELVERNAADAAAAAGTTPEAVMAKMMAKDPVAAGRFGEPAEVAAAIVFLASQPASWITGSCVTVDGGTIAVAP